MIRRTLMGCVFVLWAAAAAQALTLRDIVDLTKAGLGEEVILALIEVDGRVFAVDTETLTQLKAAGVTDKVLVALVRSGRTRDAAPEVEAVVPMPGVPPAPQIVYVEQPGPTIIREVAVPVPVYVPVATSGHGGHRRVQAAEHAQTLQPSISAPPQIQGRQRYLTDVPAPPAKAEPVYWGNGGKLRPDAWKPR